MRYLTSSIRAFSSSSGMFCTSSSVSPSSLLPKMTPTLHTPAFTPSLMSEIVSPYFNTEKREEWRGRTYSYKSYKVQGRPAGRLSEVTQLSTLYPCSAAEGMTMSIISWVYPVVEPIRIAHATQGVDGFHYMRYRTRIVAQGAE